MTKSIKVKVAGNGMMAATAERFGLPPVLTPGASPMTENDMNLHAIIDRLLDRLERANRMQPPAAELDDWRMDFLSAGP